MQSIMEREITEAMEERSGVSGLKVIRLKGYDPSRELGGLRASPLSESEETKRRQGVTAPQNEYALA